MIMKKNISFILILVLIFSLSISVFAAEDENTDITKSANVTGTYDATDVSKVYSVDISWSDLKFTYTGAYKGEWNPEKHNYEGATEAGWNDGEGMITVTNHSNTDITATPVYKATEGYESANMIFGSNSLKVATADNGTNGEAGHAVTETISVKPSGSLPEGTTEAVIGTITITIQ